MPYLSEKIKKGFERYKYNCRDTSPLSNYVMHPFWNWAVQYLPLWLAPNLMTLLGFLCTVLTFCVLAYYDPNFTATSKTHAETIPRLAWLFFAILSSLSHHLDGLDGKQARRTNTSSPVGELFDHGCDSWSTLFFVVSLYSLFGRGEFGASPVYIFIALWIVMACFILTHWEKYLTGVLYLPWSYDLSQIGIGVFYLLTYVFGPTIWHLYIPHTHLTVSKLFYFGVHASFWCASLPVTLYNVTVSYRDGTGHMLPLTEALRPVVSPLALFLFSGAWAVFSPTNVLDSHPRFFLVAVGTVFSNITCRLIVAQMSTTQSELFNSMAIVYILLSSVIISFPHELAPYEVLLLESFTVFFVVAHVLYAAVVVNDMLDHFHLRAFVISKQPEKTNFVSAKKQVCSDSETSH
jgi:ethanolaminephosphotransferase